MTIKTNDMLQSRQETAKGIILTDAEGNILSVNRHFTEMTGFEAAGIIGKSFNAFRPHTKDALFFLKLLDTLRKEGMWEGAITVKASGQETGEFLMTMYAVTDGRAEIRYCIGVLMSEKLSLQQANLHSLAYYDSLTGLPNRILFLDRAEHALTRSARKSLRFALLYFNLDDFKAVNDVFSHDFGDRLLCEITVRLQHAIRDSDTAGKLGGDEFVVFMEQIESQNDAALLAKRILSTIAEPIMIEGQTLYVSVSAGISLYPDDGDNVKKLLREADRAMYDAKESGKNQFKFFKEKIHADEERTPMLLNDMSHALEYNEFYLLYQPQYDLEKQRYTGAEILIRWQHPTYGLIPPIQFIPLAEMNGLIIPITERILMEASENFKLLDRMGFDDFSLSVNMPPRMLFSGDFTSNISFFLENYYLPKGRFNLEITENTFMKNISDLIQKLEFLRSCGVPIEIDDYGTGFTSLNYLINLPVDTLKIDRSFITGIDKNAKSRTMLEAMIAMAHSLDLNVIAEGAKEPEEVHTLESLRCDKVQGYFFSKPITFEELLRITT